MSLDISQDITVTVNRVGRASEDVDSGAAVFIDVRISDVVAFGAACRYCVHSNELRLTTDGVYVSEPLERLILDTARAAFVERLNQVTTFNFQALVSRCAT